jgi:hypothetical protein
MDFMRRSFTVLGTIVFTVLVLAALAPQAARGVATALAQATPALVQVANTSATPVLVEDPARQGVTLVAGGPNVDFSNWFSLGTTFIVPVGQRLLVEDISGSFNTPTGSHISHSYVQPALFEKTNTSISSGSVFHHIVPQLVTQGNFNIYKFQQKTWFYADPRASVHLFIDLTGGDPVTGVEVALHGHLVDCTNACGGANQ